MSNVGTFARKVYCCVKHSERFQKFKEIKEKLKKIMSGEFSIQSNKSQKEDDPSIITKSDLEKSKQTGNIILILVLIDINELIKLDINIKKLFTTLNNSIEKFDFLLFLLSLLGHFDITIDNLILLNLFNLMKEIDICKKYANAEFYSMIFSYFESLDFNLYNVKVNVNDSSNNTDNTNTVLQACIQNKITSFSLLINIFTCLFSNCGPNYLDLETTCKLCANLFNLISEICNNKNIKEKLGMNNSLPEVYFNYIKSNETIVLNSIIHLLNTIYMSKNANIDLISLINNFIIQSVVSLTFTDFISSKERTDSILLKNLSIFIYEILFNLFYTKIESLPKNTNSFLEIYKQFAKDIFLRDDYISEMKNFYFADKTDEVLKMLEDKLAYEKI